MRCGERKRSKFLKRAEKTLSGTDEDVELLAAALSSAAEVPITGKSALCLMSWYPMCLWWAGGTD